MPTYDECQELIDNCNIVMTDDYNGTGVAGKVFTSRVNGKSVFFPVVGDCYDSSMSNVGSDGFYWLASWDSDSNAWNLDFNYYGQNLKPFGTRYYGQSIRAVCE